MVSGKTIATATAITAVVAGLSYVAYFDYKRRNDRQFRRKLKRNRKKAEKTAQKLTSSTGVASLEEINQKAVELLETLADEKMPETPEQKEKYFLTQVSKGEELQAQGPQYYDEAACRFYQGLKVYPNPVELVMIYQKTVPDDLFKLIMAMMAQEVRLKQARYFDVFPTADKNVKVVDKNKKKETKGKNKKDEEVVVPDRGLFATKGFEAGEVIYEEESVVSSLLPCAQNGKFCYHCMRLIPEEEGHSGFECDKCQVAVYCSEKCRQDANDAYHQFLCPKSTNSNAQEFAKLTKDSHELAPLLIAKFFGILVDKEKKKEMANILNQAPKEKSEIDEYTTWEHLESMRYLELIPTSNDATILRKLGELMAGNVPGITEFISPDRYTMLKGKLDYNAYSVHSAAGSEALDKETEETHVSDTMRDDHTSQAVGVALYLISSHMQHSCDPNVQAVFPEGNTKLTLKALKPIAEGDELKVSFVDAKLDKETRQELLKGSYRISSCECPKCQSEEEEKVKVEEPAVEKKEEEEEEEEASVKEEKVEEVADEE